MLGLPRCTEIHRAITKKLVFERFGREMKPEQARRFDADIARMAIVNEISPASVRIPAGGEVNAIFVMRIALRRKDYDKQSLVLIARLIGQRMVMVLEYEGMQALAIWHGRMIVGEWAEPQALAIELVGLDMEQVWSGIVAGIAGVTLSPGQSLDEELERDAQHKRRQREIARLEKKMWAEKQPKRVLELKREIKRLREEELSGYE